MEALREKYREKFIGLSEAIDLIQDGDWIACGMRETRYLINELNTRKGLKDVHFFQGQLSNRDEMLYEGTEVEIRTSYVGSNHWALEQKGKIQFVPCNFGNYNKIINEIYKCRVAFVAISPPDKHGNISFGNSFDYVADLIEHIPLIIAEINPLMPFTFSSPQIHISQLSYLVETPGYILNPDQIDEDPENQNYKKIGGYLSELIEDEATLEVGIGRLNTSALFYLENKKNLGIHTEILGEALIRLVKSGMVTNTHKSMHQNQSVYVQCFGTHENYEHIKENPRYIAMRANYVINPRTIAAQHKMTAINNAVEIDLLGQVNSEHIKGNQYSGMGGIGNFAIGATLCPTGKSIIVAESVSKNMKFSKIVPHFERGVPVSLSRTEVGYVVTEYGIAELEGRSVSERARALIKIAHPAFRDELLHSAKKMNIL
jgi:acyl-CoA hydrolase